jgi:hypothetical protein
VKYLLLVCVDPTLDRDLSRREIDEWVEQTGHARLEGAPLRSPSTAITVRVRGAARQLTDGPFAETTEFVSGFDILDCQTREEAIEIAAAHPVATFGAIEVRAIPEDA